MAVRCEPKSLGSGERMTIPPRDDFDRGSGGQKRLLEVRLAVWLSGLTLMLERMPFAHVRRGELLAIFPARRDVRVLSTLAGAAEQWAAGMPRRRDPGWAQQGQPSARAHALTMSSAVHERWLRHTPRTRLCTVEWDPMAASEDCNQAVRPGAATRCRDTPETA